MTSKFILEGLECANCAAKMENSIRRLKGVSDASVNFLTRKLVIQGEDDRMPEIIQEAEKIILNLESHVKMRKA